MADDLKKKNTIKTEAGQEVKVSVSEDAKEIRIADAKVIMPKHEAGNGFVYPVDSVLQPTATAASAR